MDACMLYACILNGSFCGKISYMIGSPFRPGHSWRLKWGFSWVSDQFQTPRRDRFGMHVCMSVFMYACMECIELKWIDLNLFQTPLKLKSWKKWSCGVALHRCGGVCVYVCASPYLSEAKINNAKWLIIIIYHHFPISYVPIGMGMFHYQVRHVRLPQGSWSNRNRSIKLVSDGFWCLSSCRHVVLS